MQKSGGIGTIAPPKAIIAGNETRNFNFDLHENLQFLDVKNSCDRRGASTGEIQIFKSKKREGPNRKDHAISTDLAQTYDIKF